MPNLLNALRSLLPAVLVILSVAPPANAKSVMVTVSGGNEMAVRGLGDAVRKELGKAGWTALDGDAEYAAIHASGGMFGEKLDRPFPSVLPAELEPAWSEGYRACSARVGVPTGTSGQRMSALASARDCREQLNGALHLRWLDLKNPQHVLQIAVSKSNAKGYSITLSHFQPKATEGKRLRLEAEPAALTEVVSRGALSALKGEGSPYPITASRQLPETPTATLPELEQKSADLREVQVPMPSACAGKLPEKLEVSPESELSRSLNARYAVSVGSAKATTAGTLKCRVTASKSSGGGLVPMEAIDVVLDCGKQQFRAVRATLQAEREPGGLRGFLTEKLINEIAKGHCPNARAK